MDDDQERSRKAFASLYDGCFSRKRTLIVRRRCPNYFGVPSLYAGPCKDDFIELLGLAARLRVACRCRKLFYFKKFAQCSNKRTQKSQSSVGEKKRWNSIGDEPMIHGADRHRRGCLLRCRYCMHYFGIAINNKEDVLFVLNYFLE